MDNTSLSSSIQTFGSKIFEKIGLGDKNICLSPLSIATCFALVLEGADGSTKRQLLETFNFAPDYLTQFENLLDAFDKSDTLKVANSLWADNKAMLNTNFLATVRKHFKQAELRNFDLHSEAAAVAAINSWVKEKTAGLIPSILQGLGKDPLLVLVNAVYFCGQWRHAFEPIYTSNADFRLLNGSRVRVPFMHQTKKLEYFSGELCSAISLPYKGADSSMFIILPRGPAAQHLDELCTDNFLKAFFNTHRYAMKTEEVSVTLPKFTITNQFDLVSTLQSLGLTDAFSEHQANFSKLTDIPERAFISQAVHKTFIEVDEKGTRAAAATAVALKRKRRVGTIVEFEANRPFVYAIFHHATKQVLFLGKVVNPSQEQTRTIEKRGAEAVEDEDSEKARSPSKKQKVVHFT
jgi:serpin B